MPGTVLYVLHLTEGSSLDSSVPVIRSAYWGGVLKPPVLRVTGLSVEFGEVVGAQGRGHGNRLGTRGTTWGVFETSVRASFITVPAAVSCPVGLRRVTPTQRWSGRGKLRDLLTSQSCSTRRSHDLTADSPGSAAALETALWCAKGTGVERPHHGCLR